MTSLGREGAAGEGVFGASEEVARPPRPLSGAARVDLGAGGAGDDEVSRIVEGDEVLP